MDDLAPPGRIKEAPTQQPDIPRPVAAESNATRQAIKGAEQTPGQTFEHKHELGVSCQPLWSKVCR